MHIMLPKIIQGGMGAGVSDWRLARAVSKCGQLGVVSGTALDQILSRRLQNGDPGGHVRRVLKTFPFQKMARAILDTHFIAGGSKVDGLYRHIGSHTIEGQPGTRELCIVGNYVEVALAREEHDHPVGINYLEKIQLPHLPSIYGAMLAGVAVVIVGAGIPLEIPGVLDAMAAHAPSSYPVHVTGVKAGDGRRMTFDPKSYWEPGQQLPPLRRPDFLPVVSSDTLAKYLCRRATGAVAGFVVETATAGGHNAPPRTGGQFTADGQPVYGPRDVADLEGMQRIGLPFWLAGSYGTAERLRQALAAGAAGIQVGTAFALCAESGLVPRVRLEIIRQIFAGQAKVYTDPKASPTGFPFKVAELDDSLSNDAVYRNRVRICNLGFLRELFLRNDGTIGYRCPAEPEAVYTAKGGRLEDTVGNKCLCNALMADIGLPQLLPGGDSEKCLVTLGDDLSCVRQFCTAASPDYMAADVIRTLLGTA